MSTNTLLHDEIRKLIARDHELADSEVHVAVDDGIVIFTGEVATFPQKVRIEDHARRLAEIKIIINEIGVRVLPSEKRTDAELAAEIANVFAWHSTIPLHRLKITVHEAWATIEGLVDDWTEKEAIEQALAKMNGLNGVNNEVLIRRVEANRSQAHYTTPQTFSLTSFLLGPNVKLLVQQNYHNTTTGITTA